MTLRCRFAAALLSAALAATPLAPRAQLAPFAGKPSPSDLVETEDRVWGAADELDRAMRRQGSLYRDAALDGYLADLLHRLFPEFVGAMRVRVVDSPQMNAFALPNGSIYLNLGLVARLHDDAQLAAVLAHEGGHFVHRHGFQQRETAKNAAAFGLGLGLLIGGLGGLLVQGLTALCVFGFSRDLEREADRVAFDRMRRAGFDTRAGVRVFEAMRDEAQVLALPQPVFFASHPQMQERIDNFRQMRSDAGELDDGAAPLPPPSAEFERLVRPLREVWLQRELAQGRYRSVIHHLTQPQSESLYPLHQRAYLGDAYLLRAGDDDAANAQQAYADAVARAPEHPQAWRGLGLLALKRDDRALARQHLQRYLALAGTPPDHAFIRHYLAQLEESR